MAKKPAQSKFKSALEVIEYLEPLWDEGLIRHVKGSEEVTIDYVLRMRATSQAMNWIKNMCESELQPVDDSTD